MRTVSERDARRSSAGYSLIEALLVFSVLAIVLAIGVPALLQQIHKSRMVGYGRELSLLVQRGRYEAIRQHVTVIARLDLTAGEAIAFADVDGVNAGDPPDGIYNPIAGAVHRSTDYEIGRAMLPGSIYFRAPDGFNVIEGFTTINGEQVVEVGFDGSVTDPGSFRFADDLSNYMEVIISPAATGRVRLRKYDEALTTWLEDREEGVRWKWYN